MIGVQVYRRCSREAGVGSRHLGRKLRLLGFLEDARSQDQKHQAGQVSDAVYCRLSMPASTASPHMYTTSTSLARHSAGPSPSVAARAVLGRPELVHLCDPLLELDVLAFLVAVSLVLRQTASVSVSR